MKRTLITICAIICAAINSNAADQINYAAIIRSWGFIGDSLCSGEIECFRADSDDTQYVDLYEYSWGQQLCHMCGSEGWNFSHGGQTAAGWLAEMEGERGWGYASQNPKQAYIIAMGVNDFYAGQRGEISIDDYARDMAQIIENVKSIQPRAKFFVLTRPRGKDKKPAYDKWNDVIRALPQKFDNVYVIDMFRTAPVYDDKFGQKYFLHGHLSAAGYLWTAQYLTKEISKIIENNPQDFKDVPLIGCPDLFTQPKR